MRGDFFSFVPTHKLVLSTNHKPIIRGTDKGIRRRVHLVPFTVTIPPEEQDKALKEKLLAEASGILQWMLAGCDAWQREGLNPPRAILDATEEYLAEMDLIGQFIEETCDVDASKKTQIGASDLYRNYEIWCINGGHHPLNQHNFGASMTDRGFDRKTVNGCKFYKGIQLKEARSWPAPGSGNV
jgi:putative DNA primase/helicase